MSFLLADVAPVRIDPTWPLHPNFRYQHRAADARLRGPVMLPSWSRSSFRMAVVHGPRAAQALPGYCPGHPPMACTADYACAIDIPTASVRRLFRDRCNIPQLHHPV